MPITWYQTRWRDLFISEDGEKSVSPFFIDKN